MKKVFPFILLTVIGICALMYVAARVTQSTVMGDDAEDSPFEFVPFENIPGLSDEAIRTASIYYEVESPVLYDKEEQLFYFIVTIADTIPTKDKSFNFAGHARDMNTFVNELNFIKEESDNWLTVDAVIGAWDGAVSLAKGLWGLVRHPINTAKGLGKGAHDLAIYAREAWNNEHDPRKDIMEFATVFYEHKAFEIGEAHQINLEGALIPETKSIVYSMTNARLSGQAIFEVATLFLAWTKVTKVAKTSQAASKGSRSSGLLKNSHLFPRGEAMLSSRARSATLRTADAAFLQKAARIVGKNIDPIRTAALGTRGSVKRNLHRIMYTLHVAEKSGGKATKVLDDALAMAKADRKLPEFYHDPQFLKAHLLDNYQAAKSLGVFDDVENLRKLQFGNAPTIRRGRYAGEVVEVDHIIPVKAAPELQSNLANVRYLSRTENQAKSARLTDDSYILMEKLRSVGWKPIDELLPAPL